MNKMLKFEFIDFIMTIARLFENLIVVLIKTDIVKTIARLFENHIVVLIKTDNISFHISILNVPKTVRSKRKVLFLPLASFKMHV